MVLSELGLSCWKRVPKQTRGHIFPISFFPLIVHKKIHCAPRFKYHWRWMWNVMFFPFAGDLFLCEMLYSSSYHRLNKMAVSLQRSYSHDKKRHISSFISSISPLKSRPSLQTPTSMENFIYNSLIKSESQLSCMPVLLSMVLEDVKLRQKTCFID